MTDTTDDDRRARDAKYAREYRQRQRGGRPPREPAPCGTRAAAARHRKAGEPLCEPCRDAERAYFRDRRRS